MNGVILVGRRPGHLVRDDLWHWCDARWQALLPDWPIHQGFHTVHDDRPEFCLSVASNRAARAAADWDVAIYVGADWFAGTAAQVAAAAETAVALGQLVFAHDRTVVLTADATRAFLKDPAVGRDFALSPMPHGGPLDLGWGVIHPNTFSGVLAVPRDLWKQVGGFDERFIGWGFEDLCFWMACTTLGGGFQRVEGAAIYHLHHEQDRAVREEQPFHGQNQVLWERYREARSRAAMGALLREPGGPRA